MTPISFACTATLSLPPAEIARRILDLDQWALFSGYGPLPGIRHAAFETRTEGVTGTTIRVTNRDGSTHREEIVAWELPRRVRLRLDQFSAPVSRLATAFDETWEFQTTGGGTRVVRTLTLHPKSGWAKPVLWLISLLLKRAIARHLKQLAGPE